MPIKKDTYFVCLKKRDSLISLGEQKSASAHSIPSPIMLSGTKVLSGEGKMIIIAVGKRSAIGKIQEILGTVEETATPL